MTRTQRLQNDVMEEMETVIKELNKKIGNALINKKYALTEAAQAIIEKEIEAYNKALEIVNNASLNIEECFMCD